jgi:hypothetical protein
MCIGDYIGVGEDSIVLPLWIVKMAVKMADIADNNYTEPDRVEFHKDGRITFIFREADQDGKI